MSETKERSRESLIKSAAAAIRAGSPDQTRHLRRPPEPGPSLQSVVKALQNVEPAFLPALARVLEELRHVPIE